MHFFIFFYFFEFLFYIICLYTGHFIIVKFCQKAEKINFIKFWPLIKSPGPFCHSSAEPKSQIFGNFSSNLRRTNLKSLWGRHGTLIVILMYVCINPKMSPLRNHVRGRKNAPIDCLRYTSLFTTIQEKGIIFRSADRILTYLYPPNSIYVP